jgi:DNA-directed RNA polymerase subunit RPC12/RpoP
MQKDIPIINRLEFMVRTYFGINRLNAAAKNRSKALHMDENEIGLKPINEMDKLKGMLERQARKELMNWDIWNKWLEKVPGIGGIYSAYVILKYYYRHIPICSHCGGDLKKVKKDDAETGGYVCTLCGKNVKGDGLLQYRIEYREFPTISKWFYFMGRGNGRPGSD